MITFRPKILLIEIKCEPFKMATRVFAFEIGNLWPSQWNSVRDAACWDLASAIAAYKTAQSILKCKNEDNKINIHNIFLKSNYRIDQKKKKEFRNSIATE